MVSSCLLERRLWNPIQKTRRSKGVVHTMATNDDDYVNGEVSSIYLRSSGKLYDKHAKSSEDGLLSTMWNFPLKGYWF